MPYRMSHFSARISLIGALMLGAAGAASAGSCISSVAYDGPSDKVIVYIKNNTSTSFQAVIGKAKNTTDVRAENDTYSEWLNETVAPGEKVNISDSQVANGNKVYSAALLGTLNNFRIKNDAGLSSGTARYQGKEKNMEYKSYNQDASNPYKISCDRDYTNSAKWVITFDVTER